MKRTWRWFGPQDNVSINDMLQAGVEGVVSALHHVGTGDLWTVDAIQQRQHEIERLPDGNLSGLTWDVVESLPVSEDIKRQSGHFQTHLDNYKKSMKILPRAAYRLSVITSCQCWTGHAPVLRMSCLTARSACAMTW